MTADRVHGYLLYFQDRYAKGLQAAGLKSNICDLDITSDMHPSNPHIQTGYAKLGYVRLFETGTALNTAYGKYLEAYLNGLHEEERCPTVNAYVAYKVCVLSSDDKSEKNKFNILQFAHSLIGTGYHGSHCNKLDQFTTCWNLLQETCGSKVRGLEQHKTLLVEGCKIQSEMDTIGCHWQDMLLPHYIQASRVAVWPLIGQCLRDPMSLDDGHYATLESVMWYDLDTLISLLQPGVEDISRKCGPQAAIRLRVLSAIYNATP